LEQFNYIIKAIGLLCIGVAGFAAMSKYGTVPLFREDNGECGVIDSYPRVSAYADGSIDGKVLFQQNCQSCHSLFKELTGPALAGVSANPFWNDPQKMAVYLRSPGSLENDGYIKALRKKFGSRHMAFPDIKDEEVIAILNYIGANERSASFSDVAELR
jgi:cytochrome c2